MLGNQLGNSPNTTRPIAGTEKISVFIWLSLSHTLIRLSICLCKSILTFAELWLCSVTVIDLISVPYVYVHIRMHACVCLCEFSPWYHALTETRSLIHCTYSPVAQFCATSPCYRGDDVLVVHHHDGIMAQGKVQVHGWLWVWDDCVCLSYGVRTLGNQPKNSIMKLFTCQRHRGFMERIWCIILSSVHCKKESTPLILICIVGLKWWCLIPTTDEYTLFNQSAVEVCYTHFFKVTLTNVGFLSWWTT